MATRYDIVLLDSVPSTQDEAAARLEVSGRPTLVVTGEQTGGRGRSGRTWIQAERGMAASLALRPGWPVQSWGLIALTAGVAMRDEIGRTLGVSVGLKWPNDLVTVAGKVGGILTEASVDVVVVGCGVNLHWPHPPPGAAALLVDDPGPEIIAGLASGWADRLVDSLERPPAEWPRDDYLTASVTVGSPVRWDAGVGTAVGIGEDGSLLVATAGGTTALHSGEVHLER